MIQLRDARPADVAALCALGRATFCDTFAHLYTPEDLAEFLEQAHSPARIAANIADPLIKYQLAEDDGELVGYCKISKEIGLDYQPGAAKAMELSQLYLTASQFGSGLAARLMQWAIDQARQYECDEIVLSVYSDNPRAQAFYRRYGFEHIADTYFMVGQQRDYEFLFRLKLGE